MRRFNLLVLAGVIAVLPACQREVPAAAVSQGDYSIQTWVLPAEIGSMAPDLTQAADGRVLLSWINRREGRRNALQFASYNESVGWQSQPRTIAVGHSLLANGADTPHLLATPDGALWAQWLQTSPDQATGYDAVLARSRDGGMTWNQITRINHGAPAAEYGFASLWVTGVDSAGVAWLDGRAQEKTGKTQLRANHFSLDLQRETDLVLAEHACDCCQTQVAMTERGALLAYRGRDDQNIRDITTRRWEDGQWSPPITVHADGWHVETCPVAGPAVAAHGEKAVVAWYHEQESTPVLQLAYSADAGDHFSAPQIIDEGEAVLGRVAVAVDAQQVWVAWLREEALGQSLHLARYTPDLSRKLQTLQVATLGARGLASGYPKLLANNGTAWLVWTDSVDGVAHLKGARIAR